MHTMLRLLGASIETKGLPFCLTAVNEVCRLINLLLFPIEKCIFHPHSILDMFGSLNEHTKIAHEVGYASKSNKNSAQIKTKGYKNAYLGDYADCS